MLTLHIKVCSRYVKTVFVAVMFFCCLILSGCQKNVDTYLNSYYFKENTSILLSDDTLSYEDMNARRLAELTAPAIVAISATINGSTSIGSGVCVKSGGYILTNSHVINKASNITLYFYNNTTAGAIILWQDEIMDIAILKSSVAIPYLPMGDNNLSHVGQDIMAVGTPLSLNFTHTFTKGIVSAINRTIKITTNNGEALMQNLIQHDASLNPGNSGGPLINALGEVVGINTLKISTAEGLGFAIPINSVVSVVENVYKDYNYVTPFLGVYGYDVALENYYSNYSNNKGLYVLSVASGSPAAEADIRQGDIIIKLNKQEIVTALDFRKELYKHRVNESLDVAVVRDNQEIKTTIKLKAHPSFKFSDVVS